MTKEEGIIRLLTPYLMAFPQSKMNEGALMVYARALMPLTMAEIDAAMLRLLRTVKFFPTVAEIFEAAGSIRETAAGGGQPSPGEAWEEAMTNARTNFVYKPWSFSCPEVEEAVRRFGKMELCTLTEEAVNTARAQFTRIYRQVADGKREKATNEAVLASLPEERRRELTGRLKAIGGAA